MARGSKNAGEDTAELSQAKAFQAGKGPEAPWGVEETAAPL